MRALTAIQAEVIASIARYTEAHGFAPTVRELAEERGVHPYAMVCHLRALKRKGRLTWDYRKSRTLRLLSPDDNPAR